MSTQTQSQRHTYTCSYTYCTDEFEPQTAVKGSYCSTECYHTAKGEAALGKITRDHKYCATCFAKRVEVEYPSAEWIRDYGEPPEAFIGFEHPTPNLSRSDGLVYCKCGTVEHHDDNEFIRLWMLKETAMNLYVRLKELYDEDKVAYKPDGVTLMQALRESDCDWHLAAGRCIYQDE